MEGQPQAQEQDDPRLMPDGRVRRQGTAVVTSKHRFCHQGCVKSFCTLCCSLVALIVGGTACMTVSHSVGLVALAIGPPLLIIAIFYRRYHCSTNLSQVAFTFLEAIALMAVLLQIIGPVDVWNTRTFGRPAEIACNWTVDGGGKALVNALSFAMHCSSENLSDSSTGTVPSGDWDGLNCSSAPFGLGNGSVAIPRSGHTFSKQVLSVLELRATEAANGTSCDALQSGLANVIEGEEVEVLYFSLGDVRVNTTSRDGLARAFDELFQRWAEGGALGCKCEKALYDDHVPAYDYCSSEGVCAVVPEGVCALPGAAYPCAPSSPRIELTGKFHFTRNTVLHAAFMAYFRAAFLEETLKYIAVRRILFKDRVADCGGLIVYGLASAAGFAAAENLQYVAQGGLSAAILRMFLSIPLHCCTGMIIGMHLGYRKFLGRGHNCIDKFVVALAVPVLIHGTYDFCVMLPSDLGFVSDYAGILVYVTLVAGLVYARFTWLDLDNVCVVHVKDMQQQNRISKPQCCCCEVDNGLCIQHDPLLPRSAAAKPACDVPTPGGPGGGASEGDSRDVREEASSDESDSDSDGAEADAVNSNRSLAVRVSHSITSGLLPEAPSCQTEEQECPECGKLVRVHVLFPSDCPYCAYKFPDPLAALSAP